MTDSLVQSLAPVSRVQTQLADRVLRQGIAVGSYAYRGAEVLRWDMSNYQSFTIHRTGIGITIAVEGSNDGDNWTSLNVGGLGRYWGPITSTGVNMAPSTSTVIGGAKQSRFMRITVAGAESGGTCAAVTVSLSQAPHVPQRYADSADLWSYVTPSGTPITTATTVALKASTGNNYTRNLVRAVEISNGSASVGTVVRILSGVGILWQRYLAPGQSIDKDFGEHPLIGPRDSTNGGLSVEVVTASAAIYISARGWSGI